MANPLLNYQISNHWSLQATPTLAAAYSISRAVKIPVMCSSGLSTVTVPMAITAGAAGVVWIFVEFLTNLIL